MEFELNYDEIIHLDAEGLAEGGIRSAYALLLPKLRHYIQHPAEIEEHIDDNLPSYRVKWRGIDIIVCSPDKSDKKGESWGIATYALFTIINDQMTNTDYRFFAINGGNDRGGIFLTSSQCESAKQHLPRRIDWPYIPTLDHPWYGQPH